MHAAIKELSIKSNTTAKPLKMKDLMQHYKSKFSKNNQHTKQQYNNSKINEINIFEVKNAIKKLKTNKSLEEDNIFSEELKLLGTNMKKTLTAAVNKELQSNNFSQSIFNHGIIIPITKKGKLFSPVNTRPVILLNTIRKLLSLIILNRIRPFIEKYLPITQAAYRPTRSTTDILWAHKIAIENKVKSGCTMKITSIDLSSAFDTINRKKLIEILSTIIPESELKIIELLLTNTNLAIRYNKNTCKSFTTNIGCPQGDALSPVLFTVYLEACMKEIRATYPENSYELIYADDVNLVSPSDIKLDEIEAIFRKWGLTLNKSKTEERLINEENTVWKIMKILGSYVGTCEDIKKRKTLATLAMNRLNPIWKSGISIEKKRRI